MKKNNSIGIIIGAVGLISLSASIATIYGYSKATQNKNTPVVNQNIEANKTDAIKEETKPTENDTKTDSNKKEETTVDTKKENISSNNNHKENSTHSSNQVNITKHENNTINNNSNTNNQNSTVDNLRAGKKIYIDKLNIADKQYEQLENQLATEDLPQQGMNIIAGKQYVIYDDILNEMYQYLRKHLPKDRADQLKSAQIRWIEYKEKSIDETWPADGGSIAPLMRNGKAATLTKERCYEILYTYFD